MKNRQQLKLSDILKDRGYGGINTYMYYDAVYRQETNELCRFPELLALLHQGCVIEWAPNWGFMRLVQPHGAKTNAMYLHIVDALYKAFEGNMNVAVVVDTDVVHVYSTNKYLDEDFKTFRNRHLFKVRDMLGVHHQGHGEDSIRLYSKYSKTGDKN